MTPSELTDDVIRILRRDFFAGKNERHFFQQIDFLRQTIAYPASYLNAQGARLPASKYRAILLTVIETIKEKGNRGAIEWFPRYFATCVQRHMLHHGADYYTAAKDAESRSVGSLIPSALRKASGGVDLTVPVLAEAHRVLSARGRIRKGKKSPSEGDLFDACKPVATRRHGDRSSDPSK